MDFAQDEFRKTAKISALYDREIYMLGGTYSNMQSGFTQGWKDETHAWMSADFELYSGVAKSFGWLKFYVNFENFWTKYHG